ncbi:comF family protein [Rhizobium sp. RU20A]|uniref:ComF family protein n=1 Tax=Rhizobium sp. RU20A TaxID=1907412 RepID=UPI00095410B8|nr:ComF family protein [Rhizobium sp. RU20A]SIR46294.1 comF family protein [Rhizobium sp. RU20A]
MGDNEDTWRLGGKAGLPAAWLRRAGRSVLDAVFPPVCVSCNRLVSTPQALCPICWSGLTFLEKPYCPVLGLPFAHDLGDGVLSVEAIADPPVFERLRSAVVYEGAARHLVHSLKYADRGDLAPMMASWMLRASDGLVDGCEGIVAVPLHRYRLWRRRFNQSADLARHIATLSGRPFLAHALIRQRRTLTQVGLGARARVENVRGAFRVPVDEAGVLVGKRLLLIDDVYTTGATVEAASRALLKAGAVSVSVLTFARALPGHI